MIRVLSKGILPANSNNINWLWKNHFTENWTFGTLCDLWLTHTQHPNYIIIHLLSWIIINRDTTYTALSQVTKLKKITKKTIKISQKTWQKKNLKTWQPKVFNKTPKKIQKRGNKNSTKKKLLCLLLSNQTINQELIN